jgi:hypothetical protein
MKIFIAISMIIAIFIVIILDIYIEKIISRKNLEKEILDIFEFKGIDYEVGLSYREKLKELNEIYNDKGKLEEYTVFKKIKYELKGNFRVFGPMLILKNNKTSEIDITIIHEVGIFILEIKNLFGTIQGNDYENNWIQKLNSTTEHTFYNPILQNEGHIRSFKSIIDINDFKIDEINSIIVFGNDSVIDEVRCHKENLHIINTCELINTLNNIIDNEEIKLTYDDIKNISNIYKKNTVCDEEIAQEHVDFIKQRLKN